MNRRLKYKNRYLQAFLDRKCSVIHIKLPEYVRLWYIARYGSPVVLEMRHPARPLIEYAIRPSKSRTLKCVMTMSMAKWAEYERTESFDGRSWLTLVLPDYVYRNDAVVYVTGDSWDVYDAYASEIRESLCDFFWNELLVYVLKAMVDCSRRDGVYRLDHTLQRFLAENGASVDCYEPVRQGYFRRMRRIETETQQIRDAVRQHKNELLMKEGESVKLSILNFLDKDA